MAPARITIRVHPRARRTELAGYRDGVLQVRVTAPALENKANKAACRLLAKELGVAVSKVAVVRGHHTRDKVMEITGLDQAAAQAALSKPTR